jgi:predicted TIM-barrel fold metal-dependent hydrolase
MADDRYLVISADCHAGLPTEQYRPYLEEKYPRAFDDFLGERDKRLQEMKDLGLRNEEFEEKWFAENEEGLRGGWDAARRDKELDADGVTGEVIFPDADAVTGGTAAPFGAGLGLSGAIDPELALGGARAHNRWLAELCQDSPERRAGVAILPILGDIDAAVAEVRRAHGDGLRGGVLIPATWAPYAPYHDARYEPVWAVCEELGMPVHTHSGPAPREEYGNFLGIYVTEVQWWAWRPLWFLLWSGVFERHPQLRFVVTESGAWIAPNLLWFMDNMYDRSHGAKKVGSVSEGLSMRPTEYFDRNVFIGASNTKRRELAQRYEIGVGNIMWGNDFPHPEGTWPHTIDFLRRSFCDIPTDEARRMLGLNAADCYGFDVDALAPLAERVGPTPADLGQGVDIDTAKWDDLRDAGRHWRTGRGLASEPTP